MYFLVSQIFRPARRDLGHHYDPLDCLPAYKVRPAPDEPPGKFETGTQNHEGIAGALGALEYLEWLGEAFGQDYGGKFGLEMVD